MALADERAKATTAALLLLLVRVVEVLLLLKVKAGGGGFFVVVKGGGGRDAGNVSVLKRWKKAREYCEIRVGGGEGYTLNAHVAMCLYTRKTERN